MSDFTKIAAIIKSCKTHDQWRIAGKVVDRYGYEIMRRYNAGKIGHDLVIDLLNAATDLRAYHSDNEPRWWIKNER